MAKINKETIDLTNKVLEIMYGKPTNAASIYRTASGMAPGTDSATKTAIDSAQITASGTQMVLSYDVQEGIDNGYYVVSKGNVIGDIAAKFNTTPETLVDINGIPESRITRDGNGTITHVEIYPDEVICLPPPTNSFTLSTDTTGNGEITPDNGIFINDTLYELAIPEPENYVPAYQDMTYLATDGYRLYDTYDHQTLQILQNDAYPSETNYDPVEDSAFTEIEPADPTYTDGYEPCRVLRRALCTAHASLYQVRPPVRQDGNFTLLHSFPG